MSISHKKVFRTVALSLGSIFLILSYLCFQYIIPGFKICGSMCDFWWTWIFPSSHMNECAAVCVWRNVLYQPFMIFGFFLLFFEIFYEVVNLGRIYVNKVKM
ncbi:MAG: hypothetical protein ACXACX_10210 [Candidatus Hodarchaeales archaeon]